MQNSYSFGVNVLSRVPIFNNVTTSFSDLMLPINSLGSFNVPSFNDPDGETVTLSIAEATGGTFPNWI